jgi:hypothetical protein
MPVGKTWLAGKLLAQYAASDIYLHLLFSFSVYRITDEATRDAAAAVVGLSNVPTQIHTMCSA